MAHLSTSDLSQLRRNAKRLARVRNIPHSQALDQLAHERGYPNWSQLVKRSAGGADEQAPALPSAVPSSEIAGRAQIRQALGLPSMAATRAEQKTIMALALRYADLVGDAKLKPLLVMMDIEACHSNGCPLDLDAMLTAPRDSDIVHDIAGIQRYLNRDTGQLEGGFTPRYARASLGSLASHA